MRWLATCVGWPHTVNQIAMVKPEKARMVEGMLLNMAKQGQVQGKVCLLFRSFVPSSGYFIPYTALARYKPMV